MRTELPMRVSTIPLACLSLVTGACAGPHPPLPPGRQRRAAGPRAGASRCGTRCGGRSDQHNDTAFAAAGCGATPAAGVLTLEFIVDGPVRDTLTQSCAEDCTMTDRHFTFTPADYTPGTHSCRVRAADGCE